MEWGGTEKRETFSAVLTTTQYHDPRAGVTVDKKTDTELVARARSGDKRAFDLLVERYQPLAQRVAHGMVANAEIARDLAQEAMLQAYLSELCSRARCRSRS